MMCKTITLIPIASGESDEDIEGAGEGEDKKPLTTEELYTIIILAVTGIAIIIFIMRR